MDELKQKKEDYDRFHLEAHDLKEGYELKFKRGQEEYERLLAEVSEARERFEKKNQTYLELKEKASLVQDEITNLMESLKSIEEEIELRAKENEILEYKNNTYQKKINDLQEIYESKKREHLKLEEKNRDLKKRTTDHAFVATSLEKSIAEVEVKIEKTRKLEIT